MNKSEMLEKLITWYTDGNKAQFAIMLGVKPQTISAWIARNTFDAELIYSKCKGISADWLMSGSGEMILHQQNVDFPREMVITDPANGINYVSPTSPIGTGKTDRNQEMDRTYTTYLLPISSRGGSLTGFSAPGTTLESCEKIVTPIADVDFAITVYGDSMAPEYPSGSTILIKRIDPNLFIDWGHEYVLDTPNGVILKRLVECKGKEGVAICRSLNKNPEYSDFEIELSEVYGIYRVLMCLSVK